MYHTVPFAKLLFHHSSSSDQLGTRLMIMDGKETMAYAKMSGMTPLPVIFMGMTED